ncbi:MAG: beta-lactamase family protein [Luteimonas sp.]|nr:beta-lactamase family protein [Luteimonas sp.]
MKLVWMRRCGALCVLLGLALPGVQAGAGDAGVLAKDTRLETAGGAAFTAPEGWRADRRGDVLVLAPPEAGSTIVLVDVEAADGDAAIAQAWRASGLAPKWPLEIATDQAATDGWEQVRVANYEVPENARRYVSASARLAAGRWNVALIDFHLPDLDRRRGQIGLVFSSLMPQGHERESFAGRTANRLDEARIAQLVSFVEHAQKELQIPGIGLGLVQGGKVMLAKGLGVRDVATAAPVDADTLFIVASNTKAMTTLLLARLVDQGKVRWETPVVEVFPSFRLGDAETTRKVQVQHLVCACTGLPRQDAEWLLEFAEGTPEDVVAGLAGMQPTTEFGALYQYSNPLAASGGFIGAHLLYPDLPLGEAYDRAMQAQVFDPLGMRRTTFDFAKAMRSNHATGYGVGLDGRVAPALTGINPSIVPMRPTGGAWSNLDDMLRFVQFELDGGVLPDGARHVSEAALLARREPKVALGKDTVYGMGLMVDRTGARRSCSTAAG